MRVILEIVDKTKFDSFKDLIKDLDYVEIVHEQIQDINPSNSSKGLLSLAGIWKDRPVTHEVLREKAWPKR